MIWASSARMSLGQFVTCADWRWWRSASMLMTPATKVEPFVSRCFPTIAPR
ncbi:MAG TPA: hypothetical protein VHT52_17690 [Stellaceae bacterium]|jgi:hypothetical protein|nr:hypothetical protein [Stellaceae bacterium]